MYREEDSVRQYLKKLLALAIAVMWLLTMGAVAENRITTTVVMRVSRMTQNAVVNAGEDLSMEIDISGVEPESYRWYKDGAPIANADQKVYVISDAAVEDSGVYRMDAFDADGRMLVSIDINARVIDKNVPKSGDDSMPVIYAVAALLLAGTALALALRRKRA